MITKGFIVMSMFCLTACYSFKGISIAPEVNTFSIDQVLDQSYNAPATYAIDFSEALTNKIRKESRLILNNQNPDIVFKCKVTAFGVASQAHVPGVSSAINRLTVTIEVEFVNKQDEKLNWKSPFTRYQDFDAGKNFSTEQQRLTSDINGLLIEDIFNKAFTNW